ncbi:MAG TPA: TonB-dependent receptor plug domain-containing protein [Opitutus sp.]|nr:TonB-dependent receptor plug domain-containing protein [Opitutus sp.]
MAALLALAGAWPLAAQTPAPASNSGPDQDQTVTLSPFEVSATQDRGYQATQTLAGTRIRTNLADVSSAIQVITKEFMQDVGATDSGTLLQYTTNAEVAGTRGTYAGLGNSTEVAGLETSNLRNPESAQRVRGLAAADNTRDFFVTDIPWDSFDVDRIDIQRGPNSILFGLGSPAGIVNAATHNAEFRNFGSVEARTGSYGTFRSSIDLNQELLPKVLSIRVDGMWDDHKYEQKQAWQNDKRFFGALRFDPQIFNREDFHTSIRAKFENGDIKADRPRIIPPNDSITPWFRPVDATSLNGGMGKLAAPNGYAVGSFASTFSPWLGGLVNQQQPLWFIDGSSNELYRIYGGYVNNGALDTNGKPQGAANSVIGRRYADVFSDLTGLAGYANNAHLPNYQYGQYRNASLEDPTVFDFYHNLLDGPTASQFEKWNALNLDLQQTFWNDRLGIEVSYDRQKYKRGGQNLITNPTINIDILQNFQDYVVGPANSNNSAVANTNFGRPFVAGGPGGGNSYDSDRKYTRASLFGEVRASDFFDPTGFLAKLLGKHRFNGVYSDEQYYTENRSWQMYANSEAYAAYKLLGNPDGITNLPPVAVIYLGPSLANASSASHANIPGITSNVTLPDGNIYQFDSTWRSPTGVNFSDPWNVPTNLQPFYTGAPVINTATGQPYAQLTQVSNPANYVGWNSNFNDALLRYDNGADQSLVTQAAKTMRETKSYAASWQGFLWNDAIVPTLGWRFDEVKGKGVTALPQAGALARGALNLNPSVYALPDGYPQNQIFKNHSTAGGVVVHLNKLFGAHDFLPFNISVSYNKSNNFQVTDVRRDIYGNPIANPTGATKEYGLLLSTKDDKYTLSVIKYDTKSAGTTVQGFNNSGIYGTIRDALNWRNIKTYYMSAYAWNTAGQTNLNHYTGQRYLWDAVWLGANGRPIASGNIPAGDPRLPAGAVHLETQAEADTRRDAALKALNDMQVWLAGKGYFTAWNYGAGPTTPSALETRGQYEANPIQPDPASVYDYRSAPLLQGFAVTSDAESKGYEFEFTANPLPNWRIAFNAAETEAVLSNIGGSALNDLVSYMDTLMAGPAGDLIMFNSDYAATNELRAEWNNWRGQYTLLQLKANTATSELRKWRYNIITNYTFDDGMFKGVGIGAGYRWQDKVVIGYPTIPDPKNPTLASFDLTKPYYGPSEDAIDFWISYQRKLTKKVDWRIQLNVYNFGKDDKLIPISVQPDGKTWAAVRVGDVEQWQLTNTFSF